MVDGAGLFNFAVMTIFCREVLEGAIIIGEYRTIILRGEDESHHKVLRDGIRKEEGLLAVTMASVYATVLALVVIAAVAIPLVVLSTTFDPKTSNIIEGVSKIVAAVSLLQLSLKLPKWLGIYGSCKRKKKRDDDEEDNGLTLRSIYFNVMWNIFREVAECGIFLIPVFLSGEDLVAIPLSAVIGFVIGLLLGLGIYYANKMLKDKFWLAVFSVLLLVFLAAGLFTGGCNKLENEIGRTKTVWAIPGDFWSVHRLPMTILKPFGYNDSRTVLEIVCFWGWLALSVVLHFRKYYIAKKIALINAAEPDEETATVELGESSFAGDTTVSGRESTHSRSSSLSRDRSMDEGSSTPPIQEEDVVNIEGTREREEAKVEEPQ